MLKYSYYEFIVMLNQSVGVLNPYIDTKTIILFATVNKL